MNFDDWRYEWIKTVIKNGMPVETATKAFDEYRHHSAIDCTIDPAISARNFLESKFNAKTDLSISN